MKQVFIIILLSLSFEVFSQDILLQQNVKADSVIPAWGPNLKHFIQGYVGLGFPVYTNEDVAYTKFGTSMAVCPGLRYKHKISQNFAVGLDMGICLAAYKIKQEEGKFVPDTIINDKEKFQFNSLAGSAYMRINMGRRGNYLGNYLDLGAYGGWNYIKKHKTTNESPEGEKVKILTTRLNYVENFSYGLLTRIGINRFALTASYRLSNIFKSSYNLPELPRLQIGMELGLFR